LGTLTFLMIVITTIYTSVKVYKRAHNNHYKTMALIALLGLVSYYLHGVLNNFLDTDKVSVLFWGLTAMIVVLDAYLVPNESTTKEKKT